MRQDVEHPAAGGLPERLEVALPHLVGVAAAPDVPVAAHVESRVAQEVDRPDHVVPLALGQQLGHAVLRARHEVRLDAERELGLLAHELAVRVEVVARRLAPERVLPDAERLAEAVDVLGDTERLHSALRRHLQVALGVRRREGLLGRVLGLVLTQVDVIVGEHRGGRLRGTQGLRSALEVRWAGDLEVPRRGLDHAHRAADRFD